MDKSEIFTFCRKLKPFAALSDSLLRNIVSDSVYQHYVAGDYIFFEGTLGETGYIVLSGRVIMTKTSPNGREMIMEILPAGEFFGVVVLFEHRPYPLSAKVQSKEVEVLAIPRPTITHAVKTNPNLSQEFLAIVSQRLQTAHNVARSLAHDKVELRIASALLALLSEGADYVEIGRQELANLTGTTIETASRICKLWEHKGILNLSLQGLVYIKDIEGLRLLAAENIRG